MLIPVFTHRANHRVIIFVISYHYNDYNYRNLRFLINYFTHSDNANCIADFNEIVSKIKTDTFNDETIKIIFQNKNPFKFKKTTLTIDTPDYRNLSMPEKNAFTYVCGFLMKKCIEKHSCEVCIHYYIIVLFSYNL